MNDIITTMFNKKFLEELFKPQELYSKKALRTVFDRLAHASIMRLNQASMDKLYDLMTMAFKYQVLLCPRPKDILLISFNHMDAIRDFVKDAPGILNQVDETYQQLIEMYAPMSSGDFQLIRQTLLIFFQDMHIRVSRQDMHTGCFIQYVQKVVSHCVFLTGLSVLLFTRCPFSSRIKCRTPMVASCFPPAVLYPTVHKFLVRSGCSVALVMKWADCSSVMEETIVLLCGRVLLRYSETGSQN